MSLIDELINNGSIKGPELVEAFKTIKRQDFVRSNDLGQAEINTPLSIGFGQTISQPETVVFMLEKLQPKLGEKILDIGSGSGWTAALLAQIVGSQGKVYGVERIAELKNFAVANLNKYNFIKNGVVHMICSDGFHGLPEFSPFDKILVSAAAEEIPPELLRQLKIGGRLIIPIGRKFASQAIMSVDKIAEEKFKAKEYPGFIFVPLVKN